MSRSSIDAGSSDASSRAGARAMGAQGAREGRARAGFPGRVCLPHCRAPRDPRCHWAPFSGPRVSLAHPLRLPSRPQHCALPPLSALPHSASPSAPRGPPAAHTPPAPAQQSLRPAPVTQPPPAPPAPPALHLPGNAEEGQGRGGGGGAPWLRGGYRVQPQMKGLLGAPVAIIRAPCRVVLPQPASPASASCSRPEASWSRATVCKSLQGRRAQRWRCAPRAHSALGPALLASAPSPGPEPPGALPTTPGSVGTAGVGGGIRARCSACGLKVNAASPSKKNTPRPGRSLMAGFPDPRVFSCFPHQHWQHWAGSTSF